MKGKRKMKTVGKMGKEWKMTESLSGAGKHLDEKEVDKCLCKVCTNTRVGTHLLPPPPPLPPPSIAPHRFGTPCTVFTLHCI